MKITNQKGFAPAALLIVLVLAAVAGTGYYVWQGKQVKDKSPSVSSNEPSVDKPDVKFAVVDKSALPSGWNVETLDKTSVAVSNQGEGEDPANNCRLEVSKIVDKTAKLDDAQFGYNQHVRGMMVGGEDKGLTFTDLGNQTFSVKTLNGIKNTVAYYTKIDYPGGTTPSYYQKEGFMVHAGSYIFISESCSSKDFSQATQALAALTIKEN